MQIDLSGNDRLLSDDNFDFYQFFIIIIHLFIYF